MKALFQAGLTKEKVKVLLRDGKFAELFPELGWDVPSVANRELSLPLRGFKQPARLRCVAEKRGFVVCVHDIGDEKATRDFRRAVGKELAKLHYENILIFRGGGRQIWQVSIRPQNRPLRVITVVWYENQDPNLLLEKLDGIVFGIDEEDKFGIVDVVTRVRESFVQNADAVTRQFYDQFKKELDVFAEFISGLREIAENADLRKWLAALMLNRLMFCYFIQKKGFLDGDKNYLRNRLQQSRAKFGADQFHQAFYRKFLYRLFHEGLGAPPEMRKPNFEEMLGKIPYLNGGLFDLVDAEEGMQIPDDQFERVFNFFDQWNWHLDERPTASGKDINPDVIGYIFEKYINDRADMGAYYTQEDVTGHIARGTILPIVLRRARAECKTAFSGDGDIWKLLRRNPERYIYDAVRHGCEKPNSEIPEDIRIGLDAKAPNLAYRRKNWNRPASAEFGLPTETWREVIARRARFCALCNSLKNGKCESVEFLLSHNLDIQTFMDDALREYKNSDFITAVFRVLAGRKPEKSNQHHRRPLSVLDPACGSGAFLFAALNVFTPLYDQCLNRMKEFVEEDDLRVNCQKGAQKKFSEFRRILDDICAHLDEEHWIRNKEYWIRKSCILNNLHGTDIMPEAVEIAKLRLFLNLAAKAECDPSKNNMGLEPLPDIDFNIRPGNALVGFADMADFEAHAEKEMYLQDKIVQVRKDARLVEMADIRFREAQKHDDPEEYRKEKIVLTAELKKLDNSLNGYLARVYGKKEEDEVHAWTKSHHPFHWLSNFHGIMSSGGFDAVIGNPPYVEYSKVRCEYEAPGYNTEKCGNIYAMFIERAFALGQENAGMIVQLPLVCTDRMIPAQKLFANRRTWFSNFDDRPGKLFADMNHIRATVFITEPVVAGKSPEIHATRYKRWHTEVRWTVFQDIVYTQVDGISPAGSFLKLGDKFAKSILRKLRGKALAHFYGGKHLCYFHDTPGYWVRATNFIPYFWNEQDGKRIPSHTVSLKFGIADNAAIVCALLNSSLFYWWFVISSSCRNISKREVDKFPLDLQEISPKNRRELSALVRQLMADYKRHAYRKEAVYRATGRVAYDEFRPRRSKHIIDKIDAILARHYGLTDEELDYIVNYDVKFRTDGE